MQGARIAGSAILGQHSNFEQGLGLARGLSKFVQVDSLKSVGIGLVQHESSLLTRWMKLLHASARHVIDNYSAT